MVTEILGKKKIMIEKDHVGLNIKETKSYLSMANRLKLERHLLWISIFLFHFSTEVINMSGVRLEEGILRSHAP
jgi:hypothetical protein